MRTKRERESTCKLDIFQPHGQSNDRKIDKKRYVYITESRLVLIYIFCMKNV